MKFENHSLLISENAGSVSSEMLQPTDMKAVLTLAHGAGAGMNHSFMKELAKALAENNIGTFRFNFPYMEKKKRMVDSPAVAEMTVGKAIDKVRELFPSIPLFASGKSYGGRMSSQYFSKNEREDVRGIIFYGFPLHPPGSPSTERAKHLSSVKLPMLFLQGTKDTLATVALIQQVTSSLPSTTLQLFDDADHSFKVGKRELISELAKRTSGWCDFFI